jgi:hypothetical protein
MYYAKGVQQWANHTSKTAKFVVEPGTAADVGFIVRNSFLSDPSHSQSGLISESLGKLLLDPHSQ